MLLLALIHFSIRNNNLSYFVLNNVTNNNITLIKLTKLIDFNPFKQRLRYISYIFNLITKQYFFFG
jgi:hypothetical protein